MLFRSKAKVQMKIDLTKIEISKNPDHSTKIQLFDDIGIVMKYPNPDMLKQLDNVKSDSIQDIFNIIVKCIDYIYDKDEIYYAKETNPKELEEFVSQLTNSQFEQIQKFFSTMPTLTQDIEYNCPVCGAENKLTLSGMSSFF